MIMKREKEFNKTKLKESEKGITLIALVITIIVLLILPIFVDSQSTITIQRLTIFCLFYIGARNFLELSAIIYFDKQL